MSHVGAVIGPLCAALLMAVGVLWWPARATDDDPDGERDGHVGGAVDGTAAGEAGSGPKARRRRAPEPGSGADAVASTCSLLALSLSAGAPVDVAIGAVAEVSTPVVADRLRRLLAARQWHVEPEKTAYDADDWGCIERALALADEAGIPPAAILRQAAVDVRSRRRHAIEVATSRLRVSVVLPLGLCFLPAFVLTTVVPVVLALATAAATP